MTKLQSVFGVSKEPVLSYVQRPHVDDALRDAIEGTRQIVIYGSSKQGKSALLDQHLDKDKRVTVHCGPTSTSSDIYRSLLRQQNVEIVSEKSEGNANGQTLGAVAKFTAKLPWVGSAQIEGATELTHDTSKGEKRTPIEFNLDVAQDVGELLQKLPPRFCVLENFHYLHEDVQSKLAFDIRTFEEMGVRFIILGVWREGNRLSQYCGDLQDRISEVPVEPWQDNDFRRVILAGEAHLNVKFSETIISRITKESHGSIGVVQELLKKLCELSGVLKSPTNELEISHLPTLGDAIKAKVAEYGARHIRSLESIAAGQRTASTTDAKVALYLPYYLVMIVIKSDYKALQDGIERTALLSKIKDIHPRQVNVRASDVSAMLQRIGALQAKAMITPPLFDYDRGNRRLKVIDSTLYFFIDNCDKEATCAEIISPEDDE